MTCEKCPAAFQEQRDKRPCRAGIYPYRLNKNGKRGCSLNTGQVERYMSDRAREINELAAKAGAQAALWTIEREQNRMIKHKLMLKQGMLPCSNASLCPKYKAMMGEEAKRDG